ncbi:hypothetical protein EE612_004288 [Oryza sativa]|uniref:Uncharacterized protein n=2 Tax=Oryza nivara TaxID=4536 RepID=A0A0E0HZB7_ORYNI|nr:hypothetical protein EE612_004288 [Oryza sativa]
MSTCLIKTLALKNILDQHVVVCAWKFKIRCAMSKLWERNLKVLFCMSSIFFHALLSKSNILLSNEVLIQETNTAALSVENEAKQLYITMCACLRDCKDGTTGEELTEHITWCKVCKNIFKMNGTLPHWGCNGIKDSDDQWLNSDS